MVVLVGGAGGGLDIGYPRPHGKIPRASHMFPRLLTLPAVPLLWAALACDPGPADPAATGGGDPLSPQDPALGWLGTFQGQGGGVVHGEEVTWDDMSLVIRFDAAGDAGGCENCLTLALGDTLFQAMQVRPTSAVELDVVREGDDLRTLELYRYSGGGGTGNVVEAGLVVRDRGTVVLDALFLLSR